MLILVCSYYEIDGRMAYINTHILNLPIFILPVLLTAFTLIFFGEFGNRLKFSVFSPVNEPDSYDLIFVIHRFLDSIILYNFDKIVKFVNFWSGELVDLNSLAILLEVLEQVTNISYHRFIAIIIFFHLEGH